MDTKRHLLLFTVLVLPALSQPKIVLTTAQADLGIIYQGEVKNISIVVTNAGTSPLSIKGVETSCGCTKAGAPKPVLAPNESDTIHVTFNSAGFDGPITKHVTVQSDDPAKPFADARFTGTVKTELAPAFQLPILNIGLVPIGEWSGKTFSFVNTSGRDLAIKGFTSADSNVALRFRKDHVGPADTLAVEILVKPSNTSFVDQTVYITTDSGHQPRVPVRIGYAGKTK